MLMKIYFFLYFMMMNLFFILIIMLNLLLFEISFNPLNQLIYFIFFSIFMSINIYLMKPMLLLFLFMILIIMISGTMVLFSYFICLVNLQKMNKIKLKSYYFLSYLFIFMSMFLYMKLNYLFMLKDFKIFDNSFNYSMNKLFYFPNYLIFFFIILFMILMLLISSKICYLEKKTLRNKLL
nr:NADH dehydrogenase subunit 6 [Tetragonisca angustula]